MPPLPAAARCYHPPHRAPYPRCWGATFVLVSTDVLLRRSRTHPSRRFLFGCVSCPKTVVPFYSKQQPTVMLEYVNGFKQEFVTADMEVRDLIDEISTSCASIENEYMAKGLPVPQEEDDS